MAAHDSSTFVVRVSDLCRDMDFENLGSQDVKRVHGAHIYADVPNFHLAVEDAGGNKEEQKKLLRAASVLRRVQDQLLGENDVKAIQYQAARLHCLNYKPYNSEEEESNENRRAERAKRSVIMAITLNSYLFDVFNGVFKEVRKFQRRRNLLGRQLRREHRAARRKGADRPRFLRQPRCQGSRRP